MDDEAIGRICASKSPTGFMLCDEASSVVFTDFFGLCLALGTLSLLPLLAFSLLSFDWLIRSEDRRRSEAATLSFELLVFLLSLVDLVVVVVVVVVSSVVVVIVDVVVSFSWAFLRTMSAVVLHTSLHFFFVFLVLTSFLVFLVFFAFLATPCSLLSSLEN
jgi:hypothetical protein